ncbi:zinc finger protein 728 isoform X2 [Nasonia vitripennis]|uniref:Uncharacterized protein n=2 Tax=Nasonia vitripennis TaxID=7425 RepID=A0A7M7PYX6_NASVI|nr:zinc finger protein 728 isoform X2 [Nasonia vitripennis]
MRSTDEKVSKKLYKCSFEGCKLEFSKPSSLKFHINVHLKEKPFKCTHNDCDKAYSNPSHLKRHVLLTHDNALKLKIRCKHCQEYFSNTSNLKRHIQRTHSDTAKFCKLCSRRFKSPSLLNEHMILHKEKGKELNSFDCDQCGKELKSWYSLIKHKRRHLKNKLQCPFEHCLVEFDTGTALRDHKVYFHAKEHADHKEIHKNYTCADCGKVFYAKNNLRVHVPTHLVQEKEFSCTYKNCDKIYQFKRNLKKHIQISHLGRRFTCEVCNREFKSNQKLNQHKQNFHQGPTKSRRRCSKMNN